VRSVTTGKAGEHPQRAQLEQKLADAGKQLEQARQALKDGENAPETFRNARGGISRNVAAYEEKIKKLQESVAQHERAVEALRQQLSGL
jgi:chromosome segregation ATPase